MAATPESEALTQAHYREQLATRAATIQAIRELWPLWDGLDIATYGRFVDAAAVAITEQHQQAATQAGAYYAAFREAEIGAGITPELAGRITKHDVVTNLRATGLAATLRARRLGRTVRQARDTGLVAASGSASRMVLKGSDDTIIRTVRRDRQAYGWARVTDADPCYFCAMLASRGPAYKSRATAIAYKHDWCGCTFEPVYSRNAAWPGNGREFERLWQKTTKGLTGADARNAFRRALEGRTKPDDPVNRRG